MRSIKPSTEVGLHEQIDNASVRYYQVFEISVLEIQTAVKFENVKKILAVKMNE